MTGQRGYASSAASASSNNLGVQKGMSMGVNVGANAFADGGMTGGALSSPWMATVGQWLTSPLVLAGTGVGILVLLVLAIRSWWNRGTVAEPSGLYRVRRDTLDAAAPKPAGLAEEQLSALTATVVAAIESQQCLQRLVCETGALARQQKLAHSLLKVVQKVIPENMRSSMQLLVASAQGHLNCGDFACGNLPSQPKH